MADVEFLLTWAGISFFNLSLPGLSKCHRVRFLTGGRHGEFKFLPPSGYAPCYEALLPKEKMRLEPVKEYKRDAEGIRDLLGTTQSLSQASFIPCPIDTSQVGSSCRREVTHRNEGIGLNPYLCVSLSHSCRPFHIIVMSYEQLFFVFPPFV